MKRSFSKDFVFLLCYISYVAIYAARLNLSMASPELISGGVLTEAQYGLVGLVFFVTYACGRLLNGVIGDRIAPWVMIAIGLLLTGFANVLIGIFHRYILILIFWCVNAYAQSMLWSALLRCMTGLYGKKSQQKVSILVSSVSVGNILGIILSTWMVGSLGVRAAFLVPGIMTILLGLTAAYVLSTVYEKEKTIKQRFPFKAFIKDRKIRGMLLPAMFHGVIKDNIGTWMTLYYVYSFGIDLERSALFVLLIPTVGMVGRLLYPLCYKMSKQRENMISVCCFLLCAGFSALLCLNSITPLLAAVCLSLIYALISMINTSTLSVFPLRFADKNMVSSVSGISDFATYLGAGIGSAVYGLWNDNGNFLPMFLSWIVLCIVSVLLLIIQHPLKKD